jgi:hypothetical protein
MFQKITPFPYSVNHAPPDYKCYKCGNHGIKLWRDYQSSLNTQKLLCATCAADYQKKDISSMDTDGRCDSELGGKIDQIGWLVPAVPREDGTSLWVYMSVPQAGVDWWKKLPNHHQ